MGAAAMKIPCSDLLCSEHSSGTAPVAAPWVHRHVCADGTLPSLLPAMTDGSRGTGTSPFLQDRGLRALSCTEDSHWPVRNFLKTAPQSNTLPTHSSSSLSLHRSDLHCSLKLSLPDPVPSFIYHRCFPNKSLAGLTPSWCLPPEDLELTRWKLILFLQVRSWNDD